MQKILLGHRITIEPIYKALLHYADDGNSTVIEPAMPKLEGTVYDIDSGIKAIKEYFSAIPKT